MNKRKISIFSILTNEGDDYIRKSLFCWVEILEFGFLLVPSVDEITKEAHDILSIKGLTIQFWNIASDRLEVYL